MDVPVQSSGRDLSVPELDQQLKDYGVFEAGMATEEKINLFDTLEQSKMSAQHQPRKPEKDIEDVSILPSSPFLRRLSADLNVSASSAAASPLIGPRPLRRRPLRTNRTSPRKSQPSEGSAGSASPGGSPHSSPSKSVALSQNDSHQSQSPARPRDPSPSMCSADEAPVARLADWNSFSSTSSLCVALSRSPSPGVADDENISLSRSPKSLHKKSRKYGSGAGASPTASPVKSSSFGGARGDQVPMRSSPKATRHSNGGLYSKETAVKSPAAVRKLNFRRITSSSEESLPLDDAISAPVADHNERSEVEAQQEETGNGDTLWYVNQDGAKVVAKRAAHVTALLANRQLAGGEVELLRVWERLVELEKQYCERHADEQKGQRQPPWPDEMAPTRGYDEAALSPPGTLPYSNLRLDPEMLRTHVADRENGTLSANGRVPVENKRMEKSTPASSQKVGGSAPGKFFRGKPAMIPVVKRISSVRQLSSDEEKEAPPCPTEPTGVYDVEVSEADDASSSEPAAADASRVHARSSRLLMQSLSTQKQNSAAHKLSLKLRRRPDLPVPTAAPAPASARLLSPADPADRAHTATREPETDRSRPRRVPPPALPTLPSLSAGGDVPRRRRLNLAPDDESDDGSGAAAEKRRRLGLSTETSAELIRPAALKFPRTGGHEKPRRKNAVPVITATQVRNTPKKAVVSSSSRSSSDDDDLEMVCDTPKTPCPAPSAGARVTPIASTSRRITPPARPHSSRSTPGPKATASTSSSGSGWLSSLTPAGKTASTSAAGKKQARNSSEAGGRPSGSGLSKNSRITRTPVSSRAATENTIESDTESSSRASSAGSVTASAAVPRPVAGPSSSVLNGASAATPVQPPDADVQIECPLCSCFYPQHEIEAHASQCEGDVMEIIRDSPSPPPVTRGATQRNARAGTPPGFQRCRLCGALHTEGQEYLVHVDECVRRRRDGKITP